MKLCSRDTKQNCRPSSPWQGSCSTLFTASSAAVHPTTGENSSPTFSSQNKKREISPLNTPKKKKLLHVERESAFEMTQLRWCEERTVRASARISHSSQKTR